MTFPFAQVSPQAGFTPIPTVYIGSSRGAFSGSTYTWTSAPVALAAGDTIVVAEFLEANATTASTAMTVGGNALTAWSAGAIPMGFINGCWLKYWFGKPGAFSTVNIVATAASAVGDSLFAWRLQAGMSLTPKDVVTAAQASSNVAALNDIDRNIGAKICFGLASTIGATTYTASWTGSEAVTIDFQGNGPTGNNQFCVGHIDSVGAVSTDDLTINLSATRQRIAGALSIGP